MVAHLLHVLEVVKSHTISYRPCERDVFIILKYSAPASTAGTLFLDLTRTALSVMF